MERTRMVVGERTKKKKKKITSFQEGARVSKDTLTVLVLHQIKRLHLASGLSVPTMSLQPRKYQFFIKRRMLMSSLRTPLILQMKRGVPPEIKWMMKLELEESSFRINRC